ncbi:hypothetical protein VSR72_32660 [Paraburkholderia sp. JHI869]
MFGHQRHMAQMYLSRIPFEKFRASIELLATEVTRAVKKKLRQSTETPASAQFLRRAFLMVISM